MKKKPSPFYPLLKIFLPLLKIFLPLLKIFLPLLKIFSMNFENNVHFISSPAL